MTIEQNYLEMVCSNAKKQDGNPIYNRTVEHASVLLENLFNVAEKEILILSGELYPRVYGTGGAVQNFKRFLEKDGTSAKILVEDLSENLIWQNPLLATLSAEMKKKVTVHSVPDEVKDKYEFHFCVVDGKHYRFEENRADHSAIASFNSEKNDSAGNLVAIFGELLSMVSDKNSS